MPGKSKVDINEINKATRIKSGAQAVEMGRKGGLASQAKRRANQSMRERLVMLMNMELTDEDKAKLAKKFPDIAEDATYKDLASIGILEKAKKGDVSAYNTLMENEQADLATVEVHYELPARVVGKAFVDINRQMQPNKTYVFEGGRGGLKSSYVSLKIVEIIKNNPTMHACIVRKVAATLKDSVYSQMKWAIHELGLDDEFNYKTNPLEIRYKKTGQIIFFRGADDPMKLKSIKAPFGYIGILWKEEKDQLTGPEEERSVNQSVLRGNGTDFYDFSSYNPPKSKDNWVNRELLIPDKNRIVHHSTYKDAPIEWLGQKFIDDAEHLKEVNPIAYEHEYMGVPNGEGGNVFENIEIRAITDEEISRMDVIFQGLDFGWMPDPVAMVRLYYDHDTESIFFIDELYENKWPNSKVAEWVGQKGYDDYTITCDSAEMKSINDLKDLGLGAKPALKGPGSVEYGIKWLMCRKLVIDPHRTPNAYKEFVNYEYDRDKEGNVVSGYPDKNNHLIDATRYALEKYCNKRGTQA